MTHPMQLVREFEGRAKKRFGQHFLISEGIVDRICGDSSLQTLNRVLEIGPGLGVLTERLIQAVEHVVAVELDPDMVDFIQHRFGDHPGFKLHHLDAGKIDNWASLLGDSDWGVVANLPYNVGTGIVTSMLREPQTFSHLVVMLQKEVAERMLAPAGSRKRGSLSVFCQSRAEVRRVTKVPPGAFHPPPKVDSWVIRLDLFPTPRLDGVDAVGHERVVRAAFSAPRKAIRNGLSSVYSRERVDRALVTLGIESKRRPATLEHAEWVALARALECDQG